MGMYRFVDIDRNCFEKRCPRNARKYAKETTHEETKKNKEKDSSCSWCLGGRSFLAYFRVFRGLSPILMAQIVVRLQELDFAVGAIQLG